MNHGILQLISRMELVKLVYALLCIVGTSWTQALTICEQCDCSLSEDTEAKKGNTNVKTPCSEGRITWTNTHGAMVLELGPSYFTDFQACVIIKSESTKTKVSKEIKIKSYKNHRTKEVGDGVKLEPWFTVIDRSREYCVPSSNKQPVVLFIETETTTNSSGLPKVTILYDIQQYSLLQQQNPFEECRPCDERELIISFCTSDFVVVGSMTEVKLDSEQDKTRIGVEVDQLIRQSSDDLFTRVKRSAELTNQLAPSSARSNSLLYGHIFAPNHCGIQHGAGTFLFTGKMRLGQPNLRCAPFYGNWRRVLEDAVKAGTMECSYE